MEVLINGFVSYQLPIGLIIFLHRKNSKSNLSNTDRNYSIYLTEEQHASVAPTKSRNSSIRNVITSDDRYT